MFFFSENCHKTEEEEAYAQGHKKILDGVARQQTNREFAA